ncbi:leucine-rich repeat-containing protein 1 [Chrysochromulina tobinii]|uniref:Leucine-rich repeat-containing protein 1 n=1 Tax=Chrysochromulina tobinii TaxID=1460289 RepID=A0A0M0JEL7_9EUKA|nr:leucine-rich repeat-containing protein 1 [Chrysochromulina tobinii]|eukprot:KOO25026.1 leucine-rich repeat-containing protein 1 [Chrysochromulina sp. CCMP291]
MLSGLTMLDASDNKLTALTDAIGECTELEELILYRNGIKALPAAVGKLKKLRVLNVFNNQLIKLPPERYASCRSVTTR